MIQIDDLNKAYGDQVLFESASFSLSQGERVGLVGRNGHGKSTLLRIIQEEEVPDSGVINVPKDYRIGHLEQYIKFTKPTVLEEGCLGLRPAEADHHYKVERILFGLGFAAEDMGRSPSEFSGGYNVRLNLAKLLVSDPDLLLLDEPTNYLDIVSIRWLRNFLRNWPRELILITHDREFMDAVTTHTIGIHRRRVRKIKGPTDKLYDQLEEEEVIHEKTRQNVEKKRKEMLTFITRFRSKARKASVVQSRIKLMEKLPDVDRLESIRDLDFKFNEAPFPAKFVGDVQDLTFAYPDADGNLPDRPLIRNVSVDIGRNDRIGVIGKNGRGKSTLLKLIGGDLKPLGGTIGFHDAMRMGYFGQTNVDRLAADFTVEEEIQSANGTLGRTQIRNICGTMMFEGDLAEKRIEVLSGGERSRVLLGKILASESNLLLLDEPTSHLDMYSVEALVESLKLYAGAVIVVTHNETLLREVANRLIVFQGGDVTLFEGDYDRFLEKVGWEDEETESDRDRKAEAKNSGLSKKERRQLRSQVVKERSKVLAKLTREIESVEKDIMTREQAVEETNEALVAASEAADGEKIASLSRKVSQTQAEIEILFSRLEDLSTEHDEANARFEARLEDL